MSIISYLEHTYVFIEVGCNASLDDLKMYQCNNIDFLKHSDRIYDLSSFDFYNVSSDEMDRYTNDIIDLDRFSNTKKVAIIVSNQEGEVSARVFKHNVKNKLDIDIQIFFDRKLASDWLLDNVDSEETLLHS